MFDVFLGGREGDRGGGGVSTLTGVKIAMVKNVALYEGVLISP